MKSHTRLTALAAVLLVGASVSACGPRPTPTIWTSSASPTATADPALRDRARGSANALSALYARLDATCAAYPTSDTCTNARDFEQSYGAACTSAPDLDRCADRLIADGKVPTS